MNLGLKITFFVVALFAVVFMVLSNMGGNDGVYKRVIEEFISKSLGGYTQVGTLHNMRFFPEIIVDVEDIKFKRGQAAQMPQTPEEPQEPIASPDLSIERAQLSMGFFDIMFSTKKIGVFNIQNVNAKAGVLAEKMVSIERAGIAAPLDKEPYFIIDGRYGGEILTLRGEMVSAGTKYKFHPDRQFEFQYADLMITGNVYHAANRRLKVENLDVAYPQKAAQGSIEFSVKNGQSVFHISGMLDILSQDVFLKAVKKMQELIDGFVGHRQLFRGYDVSIDFENPDIDALEAAIYIRADLIAVSDQSDPFHWSVIKSAIGAPDTAPCCEVSR